jgi:hypothetical protein
MILKKTFKFKTKRGQQNKLDKLKDYVCFPTQTSEGYFIHLCFTRVYSTINYIKKS